jgi:hypothetical protein
MKSSEDQTKIAKASQSVDNFPQSDAIYSGRVPDIALKRRIDRAIRNMESALKEFRELRDQLK